jgi:hypothetical protein
MSTYYTIAAVCGIITGGCALACLLLETIRAHRVQINKEMQERNLALWAENAAIRAKHADMAAELAVHDQTIRRLLAENEALETENRMLMSGTPVSTIRGMRISTKEK